MGTLTKAFTFTPNTFAVASQVNADFDTLYGWVNGGQAMWSDGSTPFTGVPTGPALDPTSANQLTRKSYVDTIAAGLVKNGTGQNGILLQAGRVPVTTDVNGAFAYGFPSAFPNTCYAVVCVLGETDRGTQVTLMTTSHNPVGFQGRIGSAATNGAAAPAPGTWTIEYMALGT